MKSFATNFVATESDVEANEMRLRMQHQKRSPRIASTKNDTANPAAVMPYVPIMLAEQKPGA